MDKAVTITKGVQKLGKQYYNTLDRKEVDAWFWNKGEGLLRFDANQRPFLLFNKYGYRNRFVEEKEILIENSTDPRQNDRLRRAFGELIASEATVDCLQMISRGDAYLFKIRPTERVQKGWLGQIQQKATEDPEAEPIDRLSKKPKHV